MVRQNHVCACVGSLFSALNLETLKHFADSFYNCGNIKMYKIRIILMLSTIIPSLDCCSSRTLIDKNPIDLYRTMELSMEKTTQYPQETKSTVAQVITTVQSTISHSHHHRHSHAHNSNGASGGGIQKTDDEGENLKLNLSHGSNMQAKENSLGQQQPQQHLQTENPQPSVANGSGMMNDGQYKFMNDIIVLECVDWYRLEFCLNGGRCFLYPILNHTLLSCECAGDYVGERCEAKTPEKIPPTIHPRLGLAKTVGGPLVLGLAFMDILLLLFLFCKNSNRN